MKDINYALMLIRANKFDGAKDLLKELIQNDPGNQDILYNLGMCYTELDKPEKAVETLSECIRYYPHYANAHVALGFAYARLANDEKAKKIFQECLQLDPTDHWAAISLGNIYARNENNLDVAAFYYDMCLEHHPDDAMLACNYATLMIEKGEFQKAEVLFKKAINAENIPNAYYGLALLYKIAGEFDASKGALETMFNNKADSRMENAAIYQEASNLYKEVCSALESQAEK